MRKFLIALFATAALPAAGWAQTESDDRPVRTFDRQPDQVAIERAAAEPRASQGERPYQRVRAERTRNLANAEEQPVARGAGRSRFEQPTAARAPEAVTQRDRVFRGWTRGGEGQAGTSRGDGNRADWNRGSDAGRDRGRTDDRGQGWNRGNDRGNDARRGRDRNDDRGRDWNRDGRGDRDWSRGDNRRGEWSRGGWNGNDGRWNGNDRNFRNWDRGWRNNNRYDWQRYRSSNRYAFRLPRYTAPYNWSYGYRRQSIGAYLFAGLFAQNYWINDPWEYRLPPVYWPYQWVRYYNDALLVDTRSGYVVDVIPEIFWY